MTQIITITDNWLHDLQKAIYKFEQEYEILPHIYAHPELKGKMIATMNFVVENKPTKNSYFEGCLIEFDWDVDKDSIILKG